MRRESAEKTLLQSSEKISRNLREKFTTLSTRFATRMKATYRMKPLPPFVLAQGSRLREHFGQSNENWIQYSESRLKWYGKILVRLETCRDARSHLKTFLGSIKDFPRDDKDTTKKEVKTRKKFSPYKMSRANTGKAWAGSLRGGLK